MKSTVIFGTSRFSPLEGAPDDKAKVIGRHRNTFIYEALCVCFLRRLKKVECPIDTPRVPPKVTISKDVEDVVSR